MKLLVENIARIEHAKVTIDGISVLAGFNATGKSTISKSLNGIIQAYQDISRRAETSKIRSVDRAIDNFLASTGQADRVSLFLIQNQEKLVNDLVAGTVHLPEHYQQFSGLYTSYVADSEDFFNHSSESEELYQNFRVQAQKIIDRPKGEDIRFLVQTSIREAFDNQINTLGQNSVGIIQLLNDNESVICGASFQENKIKDCSSNAIKENAPIYLEPRHALDELYSSRSLRLRMNRAPILNYLEMGSEQSEESKTLEAQETAERVAIMINNTIEGGLVKSDDFLQYVDERLQMPISIKNVASGNKTFAVIKRLVENGCFYHNHTLIIDEPEVNLHPAWQLILAEVLVILHKELGLKVFLNTHSPYFARAVETYSMRYEIKERCHFYRTAEGENGLYRVEDVTEETEKIFRDLYLPLEGI